MKQRTNRVVWWLTATLAGVLLSGIGRLGVWLRPYWVAKYRGEEADLRGAMLVYAPLRGANLHWADLRDADLRNADLAAANLENADLRGADLSYAHFSGAMLWYADLEGSDLRGADLRGANIGDPGQSFFHLRVDLAGARYNRATTWPNDFDPKDWGAVLVNRPAGRRGRLLPSEHGLGAAPGGADR